MRVSKQYLSRLEQRTLPNELVWHYFHNYDDTCVDVITTFLNTHYGYSNHAGIVYSTDALKKVFMLDEGLSERMQSIHHRLSLGIIHQVTGELIALIVGRPSLINHNGVFKEVVVVSLMCVHNDYKNDQLGPLLITQYYKNLDQYSLAKTAVFSGHHLPFYKQQMCNDYIAAFDIYHQSYKPLANKVSQWCDQTNHIVRFLDKADTHQALNVWDIENAQAQCYQVFASTQYFYQQLSDTNHHQTWVIEKNGELQAWFAIEFNEYRIPDQAGNNTAVANLVLLASKTLSHRQVVEVAIAQLINTSIDLLILPNHLSLTQEDKQQLRLILGDDQWIYSVQPSLYFSDSKINILFF